MATSTTRLGLSKPAVTDLIVNFPPADDAALDTLDAGMWIFRGTYNAATAYVVNDVVALSGVLYVAVSPSTGSAPPSAAWAPGAAPGGTYVQALTTQDGTPLNPAPATLWSFQPTNGSVPLAPFSVDFQKGLFGGITETVMRFGYNPGQDDMAGEIAGWWQIHPYAGDTTALELYTVVKFPDGTPINLCQVLAKRDNTYSLTQTFQFGRAAGDKFQVQDGNNIAYMVIGPAVGGVSFNQQNISLIAPAASNAALSLGAAATKTVQIQFKCNNVRGWEIDVAANGPMQWYDVLGSNTNIMILTGGATAAVANLKLVGAALHLDNGVAAGATNVGASISFGTGAPVNGSGANGDIYLRVDGGALTTIYQRRAAAWVGIV